MQEFDDRGIKFWVRNQQTANIIYSLDVEGCSQVRICRDEVSD